MISKTKVISPSDDDDIKLTLSRACDMYNKAYTTSCAFYTKFLSPQEANLIKQRFPRGDITISFFGGYDDAERCICGFGNGDDFYFPITALRVKCKSKNAQLSHRDYMGTVLSLGLKRETLGDIITEDGGAVILCLEEIADYICDNLVKVGGIGVSVFKEEPLEVLKIERNYSEISATVSSLRCDSVIAAALRLSRTKASELIDRGLATHNYEIIKSAHRMVEDEDVLSVRGYGKFKVKTTGNLTKKGRVHIDILKYI